MNRRKFLSILGGMSATIAVAPVVNAIEVFELFDPETSLKNVYGDFPRDEYYKRLERGVDGDIPTYNVILTRVYVDSPEELVRVYNSDTGFIGWIHPKLKETMPDKNPHLT